MRRICIAVALVSVILLTLGVTDDGAQKRQPAAGAAPRTVSWDRLTLTVPRGFRERSRTAESVTLADPGSHASITIGSTAAASDPLLAVVRASVSELRDSYRGFRSLAVREISGGSGQEAVRHDFQLAAGTAHLSQVWHRDSANRRDYIVTYAAASRGEADRLAHSAETLHVAP